MHRASLLLGVLAACLSLSLGCAKGSATEEPSGPGSDGGSPDGSLPDGDDDASVVADGPVADATPDTVLPEGGDAANACVGVTCEKPPANTCADAQNLTVYDAKGSCDNGACQYASHLVACKYGCKQDACDGDPCVGKTCSAPPANTCADANHLTVYEVPGSCSNGECSYATHLEYCGFGCSNDVCDGDPCVGKTCNSPPANFCTDTTNLEAYTVPGTCSNGVCSYAHHEEFCTYGCLLGACQGDPCQGMTCTTPPASYCAGPNTLRKYQLNGTCTNGSCVYSSTDLACPFGCVNGACKDCVVSTDCGGSQWCNAGTCITCNTDQHCGASCTDCTSLSPVQICNSQGTACVQCTTSTQCGAGKWCNNGACATCNTTQHCGSSCTDCSTLTPVQTCNASGTACIQCANNADCGSGSWCNNNMCAPCNTNEHCGASCTNCSTLNPVQTCNGAGTECIQCTNNADCGSGKWCNNSLCEVCNTAQHCGATCVACSGATPDCNGTQCYCQSGSCGPPCPVALLIGGWGTGADGWTWDGLWRRDSAGYMVAGSSTSYASSYTQNLTYGTNVDLSTCTTATLSFEVRLADDPNYSSSTDKSERLFVQCSKDGGANWVNLTPSPWPANQSACATSYCSGGYGSTRAFPWTSQTITLSVPNDCKTATTRFRFQAKGASAWRLQNPGWYVDTVTIN